MELINNSTTAQTVAANGNVVYNEQVTGCNGGSLVYRMGSGQITMRGNTEQCRARYRVAFDANIAVPTDGTVGEISLAIALNGEPLGGTYARVTPTVVNAYFHVSGATYVNVPQGCCYTVAIENTSNIPIDVLDPNLIVERVA